MDDFEHFDEIGDYCIAVGQVSWEKPRRGGYCYGRVWTRRDPQKVVKCLHRHREPAAALACVRAYVRSGKALADFAMD
jgi:hypothetical protein